MILNTLLGKKEKNEKGKKPVEGAGDSRDEAVEKKTKKTPRLSSKKRGSKRIVHTKRSFHRQKPRENEELVYVYDILKRPVITEKAAALSEKRVYTFLVSQSATKHTIARAIESRFKVTPCKICVINRPRKAKRIRIAGRERQFGSSTRRKRAYVYLKEGDTIQLS